MKVKIAIACLFLSFSLSANRFTKIHIGCQDQDFFYAMINYSNNGSIDAIIRMVEEKKCITFGIGTEYEILHKDGLVAMVTVNNIHYFVYFVE